MGKVALLQMIIIMVLLAMFSPFATIWALNTLFPNLAIPYGFWTWLAMVWLHGIIMGRGVLKRA